MSNCVRTNVAHRQGTNPINGGLQVRKYCRWMLLGILAIVAAASPVKAQQEFKDWPAGTTPRDVGKRVAERFVVTPHTNFGRAEPPTFITYPESVTWYG